MTATATHERDSLTYELTINVSTGVEEMLRRTGEKKMRLAELLRYSPSTITRSLNGDRVWSLGDVAIMAKHFRKPAAWFLTDREEMERALAEKELEIALAEREVEAASRRLDELQGGRTRGR